MKLAREIPRTGPELAIQDPEVGEKLRAVRILRPDEVRTAMVIEKVKKELMAVGAYDPEMRAKLESAMDDPSLLTELATRHLSEEERLRWGMWDEDDPKYRRLEEADLLVKFVVDTYKDELQGFKIASVFQERIPPAQRKERLGTAMKLPGKMAFLTEVDALLTLAYDHWRVLSDRDRQRLVHHELEHLVVIDGTLALRGHDFEDFIPIVKVYGLHSEAGIFSTDGHVAAMLASAGQLDLLNPTMEREA